MRCYDTWERRTVRLCGVRWGGAVGLDGVGCGALGYPTPWGALRFFDAGARAARGLGRRPAASAALMDVGIFVWTHSLTARRALMRGDSCPSARRLRLSPGDCG